MPHAIQLTSSPVREPVPGTDRPSLFTREPQRPPRWLPEAEEVRLHAALSPEAWPVVALALNTGLDRGTVCGLARNAVDLTRRVIHAERRKGRRGDAISVTVPINATLLAVLRALPSRLTSPWVFPSADATKPLDGREYDRLVFRPARRHAKIRDLLTRDRARTHALRRSRA